MFSCPMMTGVLDGGVLYILTSVPQIPPTSIFSNAASSGISGIGYSRISVLLGPTLTAATTFSATNVLLAWFEAPSSSRVPMGAYSPRVLQRLSRLSIPQDQDM